MGWDGVVWCGVVWCGRGERGWDASVGNRRQGGRRATAAPSVHMTVGEAVGVVRLVANVQATAATTALPLHTTRHGHLHRCVRVARLPVPCPLRPSPPDPQSTPLPTLLSPSSLLFWLAFVKQLKPQFKLPMLCFRTLLNPKSAIFAAPSPSNSMFAGLRS